MGGTTIPMGGATIPAGGAAPPGCRAANSAGREGRAFGQMAEQMGAQNGGVFSSLGFGAYIVFASAIYLAFKGVMKFLGRS